MPPPFFLQSINLSVFIHIIQLLVWSSSQLILDLTHLFILLSFLLEGEKEEAEERKRKKSEKWFCMSVTDKRNSIKLRKNMTFNKKLSQLYLIRYYNFFLMNHYQKWSIKNSTLKHNLLDVPNYLGSFLLSAEKGS